MILFSNYFYLYHKLLDFYDRCETIRRNVTERCKNRLSSGLREEDQNRSYCCKNLEMEKCFQASSDNCGKYHLNVYFSLQQHKWSSNCNGYPDLTYCQPEVSDETDPEMAVVRGESKNSETHANIKNMPKYEQDKTINTDLSSINILLISIVAILLLVALFVFLIVKSKMRHSQHSPLPTKPS